MHRVRCRWDDEDDDDHRCDAGDASLFWPKAKSAEYGTFRAFLTQSPPNVQSAAPPAPTGRLRERQRSIRQPSWANAHRAVRQPSWPCQPTCTTHPRRSTKRPAAASMAQPPPPRPAVPHTRESRQNFRCSRGGLRPPPPPPPVVVAARQGHTAKPRKEQRGGQENRGGTRRQATPSRARGPDDDDRLID